MLAKRFEDILHKLGMAELEHPLFYHAPVGIRFEIGGEEPIYLDRSAAKLRTNPAYVQGALDRAAAIYRALPEVPDLLQIDGYPDEEPAESLLTVIRQRMGLPVPNEQLPVIELDEDGDTHAQVQFYWDLSGITFQPEQLLQEIILGDIGGWAGFVSSVYLTGPGPFLYHLYDDRGGWMCWAVPENCFCRFTISFMAGSWSIIWSRLTGCLQRSNHSGRSSPSTVAAFLTWLVFMTRWSGCSPLVWTGRTVGT